MVAFAAMDNVSKFGMIAVALIPFVVLFLSLGALASPGARLRETGLVLLIAAGWTAFAVATLAYMIAMPDTRPLFPPESRELFADPMFGVLNLILMAAIGYGLFRRGGRAH